MTSFEKFLEFMASTWRIDALILGKLGVLLFLFLYLIFTLVLVKQIKLMCATVTGILEKELLIAAKVLVGLAIVALVLGIIVL